MTSAFVSDKILQPIYCVYQDRQSEFCQGGIDLPSYPEGVVHGRRTKPQVMGGGTAQSKSFRRAILPLSWPQDTLERRKLREATSIMGKTLKQEGWVWVLICPLLNYVICKTIKYFNGV
jgi:hypothetical protein